MTAPPPLPYRARPTQVLLTVGAVLVVCAGAATAARTGGPVARGSVLLLAVAAGGLSAWSSRVRLRSTREALAAAAVALTLVATAEEPALSGSPATPVLLAAALAGIARLQPGPLAWPLGAWAAFQLAALRLLEGVADGPVRTAALLTVALTGLVVTLAARRPLARIVLVTTAPWWLAGVLGGATTAWSDGGPAGWASAALTVAAAAGLLVVRLEPAVEGLTGPPAAVPVLSGAVAGTAVAGALSAGTGTVVVAGYLGVLLAAVAAATLEGWRRGLLLPAAVTAGATLVTVSVVQLVGSGSWRGLVLLLVLTAVPSAWVAVRRADERPVAVPTAVGCLAAAALVAVPGDLTGPAGAAAALTGLYGATLVAGGALAAETRRPTTGAGVVCAVAAVGLVLADGDRRLMAAHLAVQGALAVGVAWTARSGAEAAAARGAGSVELVLAAWTTAALAGARFAEIEAYTLTAAAGLLLAAGPRLRTGPSGPAWGPGLLVAAVPSTVLAVTAPGALRPVLVLVAAALAMAGGARWSLRAPLVIGAVTAVALGLGLAAVALPLPVTGALAVGVALLALGARRELRPAGGSGARLADLR
ncbi:SCO7613 C-terminal domain-containing membrane protein [Blastococcus sp. SYSU D00820]